MRKILILIIILLAVALAVLIFLVYKKNKTAPSASTPETSQNTTPAQTSPAPTTTPPVQTPALALPINQFKERITKKPFGIYITPATSPVQPERFSGYHTGADAEYQDVTDDVPVYAIADATVVLSKIVSGYGGCMMIDFTLNGVEHTALYGHIRPNSLPKLGAKVAKGDQLGVLGTGYSSETDGERRHLHFAILSDNRIDVKGYVQNKSELSGWLDPLTLY